LKFKRDKMENDVKTERKFLLIVAGALGVFALMLVLWSGSTSANTAPANSGSNGGYVAQATGGVQDIYIKALGSGVYDKRQVTVKKGVPVRLHFSAEKNAGCGKYFMMKKFNITLRSNNGEEQVAQFTPTETGTFEYSCSMRMFIGKMTVVA